MHMRNKIDKYKFIGDNLFKGHFHFQQIFIIIHHSGPQPQQKVVIVNIKGEYHSDIEKNR